MASHSSHASYERKPIYVLRDQKISLAIGTQPNLPLASVSYACIDTISVWHSSSQQELVGRNSLGLSDMFEEILLSSTILILHTKGERLRLSEACQCTGTVEKWVK